LIARLWIETLVAGFFFAISVDVKRFKSISASTVISSEDSEQLLVLDKMPHNASRFSLTLVSDLGMQRLFTRVPFFVGLFLIFLFI
jgi:hypothetical protein